MTQPNGRDPRDGGAVDIHQIADTLWKSADALRGQVDAAEYKHVEAHGGNKTDVSIFGQESNPTTWRLAHMNLAIHGIEANLGPAPADTFLRDQHPDLKADFVRSAIDDE
jgi:type I restriction-modification system DNA methylase subunit